MSEKQSKLKIILEYIKEAFKLEFGSQSGRFNVIFFVGTLLISLLGVGTSVVIDIINLIYSLFWLGKTYESSSNYLPFIAAFICGALCLFLMVFVVDSRNKVLSKKKEIEQDAN